MKNTKFINLLKKEVIPALGCTEPMAVAYATAKAAELLEKIPDSIELYLSANIIKNALGVGIPGTDMIGIDIAAALGAIGGNADAELQVLKDINEEDIKQAKKFVEDKKVTTTLKPITDKLYIETICRENNNYSKVIIKGAHNNIVKMELNNEVIFQSQYDSQEDCSNKEAQEMTIKEIYEFITTVDFKEIEFILDGAEMNKKVSEEGLKGVYGLQVGKKMNESEKLALFSNTLSNKIIAATAAASDARMSGCTLPIMTTAGSGNQGITSTLPSVILAETLGKSKEELARALVLSNLVTIHMKAFIGRLSPLCGAGIAASTGTCTALTYLLGGNLENINCAIKNMIADISGMICDGAKTTCALKIATSVNAAIQCATLALNNIHPTNKEGIIHEDVEQTIKNLANLGIKGMESADNVILDMMLKK